VAAGRNTKSVVWRKNKLYIKHLINNKVTTVIDGVNMIQIQCTGKIIKEFEIEAKEYNIQDELYKWHANLFMVDDIKCSILINDLSYYGFIIYDIGDDFTVAVKEAIRKNLLAQYASKEQVDEYLDNEIVFSKTSNKKVIGKMNALAQYALHSFAYGEEDIDRLNLKLGHYDFIDSEYVGDYIVDELNKRMPDKIFDRSIVDDEAQQMWDDLPEETRQFFLKDLHCFTCSSSDTEYIKLIDDKVEYRIEGKCKKCGNKVVTPVFKGNCNKSALVKWNAIPGHIQKLLIDNAYCGSCGVTTIIDFDVKNDEQGIVLEGKCKKCGNKVARFIENNQAT
jgi:hypothetical protein